MSETPEMCYSCLAHKHKHQTTGHTMWSTSDTHHKGNIPFGFAQPNKISRVQIALTTHTHTHARGELFLCYSGISVGMKNKKIKFTHAHTTHIQAFPQIDRNWGGRGGNGSKINRGRVARHNGEIWQCAEWRRGEGGRWRERCIRRDLFDPNGQKGVVEIVREFPVSCRV